MITGLNSWNVLAICFVITLIMRTSGGLTMAGYKSIFVGLANIILCLIADYVIYNFFKMEK